MSPTVMPTAARATPIMLSLPVVDAPDFEELAAAELDEVAADEAAEPVCVPAAVGVADAAGYMAPRALISKGWDSA